MKGRNMITMATTILLCGLAIASPVRAVWYNPTTWGVGLDSIGNVMQAVYMFFYNAGFVIIATVLFLAFFAIEIGLIYIYWRVGSAVYNTVIPAVKRARDALAQ